MDNFQDYLKLLLFFLCESQTIFVISFILGCVWFYKGEGRIGVFSDKFHYSLIMILKGLMISQGISYILPFVPFETRPFISLIMMFYICKHSNII